MSPKCSYEGARSCAALLERRHYKLSLLKFELLSDQTWRCIGLALYALSFGRRSFRTLERNGLHEFSMSGVSGHYECWKSCRQTQCLGIFIHEEISDDDRGRICTYYDIVAGTVYNQSTAEDTASKTAIKHS